MFTININLKKCAAIAAIALTSILGAADVGAQPRWTEEALKNHLQKQAVAQAEAQAQREKAAKDDTRTETTGIEADRRAREKAFSKTR